MEAPSEDTHNHAAAAAAAVPPAQSHDAVVQAPQAMPPPASGPMTGVAPPPYQFPSSTKYVDYMGEAAYAHTQYHPKGQPETYIVTIEREPSVLESFWGTCALSSCTGCVLGFGWPFCCICCMPNKPARYGWGTGAFIGVFLWGVACLIAYAVVFAGTTIDACIETAHANSGQLVLINGTPQVATVVQSPETIRRECQALQGLLVVGGSIALILGVAGIGTMLYLHRRYMAEVRARTNPATRYM